MSAACVFLRSTTNSWSIVPRFVAVNEARPADNAVVFGATVHLSA
jgi:hypothetical protein